MPIDDEPVDKFFICLCQQARHCNFGDSLDNNLLEIVELFQVKISAKPHPTLCIQFLDRENNDENNTLPLRKQICFKIAWGCAEIFILTSSAF